jgi:hypothetical protein
LELLLKKKVRDWKRKGVGVNPNHARARDQEMVRFMRCDNSPENKRLAEEVNKRGLKVNFEFTAPRYT